MNASIPFFLISLALPCQERTPPPVQEDQKQEARKQEAKKQEAKKQESPLERVKRGEAGEDQERNRRRADLSPDRALVSRLRFDRAPELLTVFGRELKVRMREARFHLVHVTVQQRVVPPAEDGRAFRSLVASGLLLDARGTVVATVDRVSTTDRLIVEFHTAGGEGPRRASLVGFDDSYRMAVLNVGPVPMAAEVPVRIERDEVEPQAVLCFSSEARSAPSLHLGSVDVFLPGLVLGENARADLYRVSIDALPLAAGGIVTRLDGSVVGMVLPAAPGALGAGGRYALPMSTVLATVKKAQAGRLGLAAPRSEGVAGLERIAWMGLRAGDLDPLLTMHLTLEGGVVVTDVFHDGPAKTAGLLRHDILVQWGDTSVKNIDHFEKLVTRARPGDVAPLSLLRRGQRLKVELTLGAW